MIVQSEFSLEIHALSCLGSRAGPRTGKERGFGGWGKGLGICGGVGVAVAGGGGGGGGFAF